MNAMGAGCNEIRHAAHRRALLIFAILFAVATPLQAAGGWYLLIPPRSDYNERAAFLSSFIIFDNKPLSQWAQEGAYDSALECETLRHDLLMAEQHTYSLASDSYIKAVAAKTDPGVLEMRRSIVERHNANVSALMASRCIRSSDPRLRR